jgi:cation transport regulator ChaB
MSDTVPDKVKEAFEDAKKAVDRREDQIEETAAQKVEPHIHEARELLADA